MLLKIFTDAHVLISLVGIFSGFVVLYGFMTANHFDGWTSLFLWTTVLTSVTGFLFPIHGFTPALGVVIVSMVVLAIALFALYGRHLTGAWRWIYVVTALTALWFNVFVLIVQSFEKVLLLNPAAPQFGPPFPEPVNSHFAIAQAAALAVIVVFGLIAAFKFRPGLRLSA